MPLDSLGSKYTAATAVAAFPKKMMLIPIIAANVVVADANAVH